MQVLEIPLGDEVLEVDLNDLKGNDEAIIDILKQEKAPLHLFADFAHEYYSRDMIPEFEKFLLAGVEAGERALGQDSDRLLILNTLVCYYIETAKTASKPEESIQAATILLNRAQSLPPHPITFVAKGNIYLFRKEHDKAADEFRNALREDPNCLTALFGLASIQFMRKEYTNALKLYQRALVISPESNPDVRVPIGLCFEKLNMTDYAQKAFKRALELNPDNETALALSSMLDMEMSKKNESKKEELIKSANQKLMKAYKINPKNCVVANEMGERLLNKESFDKALVFAETAIRNVDGGAGYAESILLKARILQAKGDYKESLDVYKKAEKLFPNSKRVLFGLGQMHTQRGNFQEAISCFEKVLKQEPSHYESLKSLGYLYAQSADTISKAKDCYSKIKVILRNARQSEYGPEPDIEDEDCISDASLLIEMGLLYEKSSIREAGKAYGYAYRLLQESENVPPELLNNLAAFYQMDAEAAKHIWFDSKENQEESRKMYEMALAQSERLYQDAILNASKITGTRSEAVLTITRYNVARLYEAMDESEKADHQYEEILKRHPTFIDAWLRLADKQLAKGDHEKAIQYISNAIRIDQNNSNAWNMLGITHFTTHNHRAARKCFEKVLKDIDRYDSYALCSVGFLCLVFGQSDPEQRSVHCKRAVEFFSKTLRQNPNNIFAATGIALAFSMKKMYSQAQMLLRQVLEASPIPSVTIHLANISVEMGEIRSAIPLYEGVLKRPNHVNDGDVLSATAKAYYILGKDGKDPASIKSAIQYIQKAIRADPTNFQNLFNLCVLSIRYSNSMNEVEALKRKVADMQIGLNGLVASEKLLQGLAEMKEKTLGFPPSRAKDMLVYCQGVKKVTEKKIHETTVLENQRNLRLEEVRLQRLQEKEEKEAKELERKRLLEMQEMELEEQRAKLQEKIQKEIAQEKEEEKEKEEEEQDSPEPTPAPAKKKRKRKEEPEQPTGKKALSKAIISDSEED